MKRLITSQDFIDLRTKLNQRGAGFISSKFTFSKTKRTLSAFDSSEIQASNWWIIPEIKRRWNYKITGDKNKDYEQFLSQVFYADQIPRRLLSIGSGVCSHELRLAALNPHWTISCLDIAGNLLETAKSKAGQQGLNNITFRKASIHDLQLERDHYDLVLFHSSLHHFDKLDPFIKRIKSIIKPGGDLIINEFVGANRLQFNKAQLEGINQVLKAIPDRYKSVQGRGGKDRLKEHYSGSGLLRMIIADPSECVESASIMPLLKAHFKSQFIKGYGGNLLMSALKDIAHHFVEPQTDTQEILQTIFDIEDHYLQQHSSDFVFGIFRKQA